MGSQIGTFFIIFWCYQEVQKQDIWVWYWYKSKHWGVKMYTAVLQSFFWAEDRKVQTCACSCVCVCVLPSVMVGEMLCEGRTHILPGTREEPDTQGDWMWSFGKLLSSATAFPVLRHSSSLGPIFLRERVSRQESNTDTPTGLGWGSWLFHNRLEWTLHQPFSFLKAANVSGGCQIWILETAHPESY